MPKSESAAYNANKAVIDKFLPQYEYDARKQGASLSVPNDRYFISYLRDGRYLIDTKARMFIAKLSADLKTLATKKTSDDPEVEKLLDQLEAEAFMQGLEVNPVDEPVKPWD